MTTESPERPSRLELEVREILERSEAQRTPMDHLGETVYRGKVEARRRLTRPSASSGRSSRLTPDVLRIAGALALAIIAALAGEFSRLLAIIAAFASLILFFSLWFPTARVSSIDRPRWRGRDLN